MFAIKPLGCGLLGVAVVLVGFLSTQRFCKGGMRYGRTQHGWFDGSSTNQLEAVIDSVIQINLDDFVADGGDDESFDDEY